MRSNNIKNQLLELRELQNKNRNFSKNTLAKVVADRKRYEASMLTFNQGSEEIKRLGDKLLRHLSLGYLDTNLEQTKRDMGHSWTTVGLNRNIRELTRLAITLAEEIKVESHTIKKHADDLYDLFWSKHGFDRTVVHELKKDNFIHNMLALELITDDFCTDPTNII